MIYIICLFLLGSAAADKRANNHKVPPTHTEVDNAFESLGAHYNDKLCLELLIVDCTQHVTVNDEQICASNGKTYPDHCHFVHALCEFLHSPNPISLVSHGVCPTTVSTTTSTMAPVTQALSSSAPIIDTTTSASVPVSQAASTSAPGPAATSTAATTVDPLASIIQNVFCQNSASVSCATGLDILCASDGQLYPNQCEFAKARCKDATLTVIQDQSTCMSG